MQKMCLKIPWNRVLCLMSQNIFLPIIVNHFKATKDNLHLNFKDFIPELADEEQLCINFSTLAQFQNPQFLAHLS